MNKKQIIYVDNKPYIKCNMVMLFSPKGGNLFSIEDSELIKYSEKVLYENILHQIHPFNLYITSDEEIKESDHYLKPNDNSVWIRSKNSNIITIGSKKIIATTDESLGLPQLSQQFIEKYIEEYNKGHRITKVLVEVEEYEFKQTEWFQEAPYTHKYKEWRLKLDSQNQITIRKHKDSWSREEVNELCKSAYVLGANNQQIFIDNSSSEIKRKETPFNEWIEENL